LSQREVPPQTINFLSCTLQILLSWMRCWLSYKLMRKQSYTHCLRYLRYRTNTEVICINQDVPTYFYAVQRSRLPVIAMLLDRGLSDTNTGEVNQVYCTKFMKYFGKISTIIFLCPCCAENQ
jgi:hypothetical protein